MKIYLNDSIFKPIVKAIAENKLPCYVIGGYVRDILLGRSSKDIDIMVVGSGIRLARKVASVLGKDVRVCFIKYSSAARLKYGSTLLLRMQIIPVVIERNSDDKPFCKYSYHFTCVYWNI